MNKRLIINTLINLLIAYVNIEIALKSDFIPLSICCSIIAGLSLSATYMMISQTTK